MGERSVERLASSFLEGYLRYLLAFIAVFAIGCAGNPPPNPHPQPPPLQAMGVEVHDFVSPDVMVEGVRVECNGILKGFTDEAGYTEFEVPTNTQQDCILTKDGYEDNTASLFATYEDAILRTWIRKMVPPAPVHPNPLVGRLTLVTDGFRDDTGYVNPLYAHCGDCFSRYTRDPEFVQRQLDLVAQAGYHGIRVWSTLGGSYWAGREVGPSVTPDYWGQLRKFFEDLKARNLRAVFSQGDIGQLGTSRQAFMEQVAALDRELGVIDWLDCGNEAWQTGEPSASRLAECVSYYRDAGGRALLTLTSPIGEEKDGLDRYSIPPADTYDVHGYRGGHFWDKIRHIFSIPYEIRPNKRFGIQSEPFGNGERVSVTSNKNELNGEAMALGGTMSLLSRQTWVWFSGEGVILDKGLEVEAGFWETPKAVALIPKDAITYDRLHHSGTSQADIRTFVVPNDSVRIDGRTDSDGRTVQIIYGPAGTYNIRAARNFEGRLCHPETAECSDLSVTAGSSFIVSFDRGRILIGQSR